MPAAFLSGLFPQSIPTEFLYPSLLFLAIPAVIVLLWLTRTSFVPDNPRYDDAASIKRRSKLRWSVFFFRLLAVMLMIIAIATPLAKTNVITAGDTHLTVLIDNSSSMNLLDTSGIPKLLSDLRAQAPVTVYTLASGESSDIGTGILNHLKPNENLLLITDGYSTTGPALGDVASFAHQQNSTISAVSLKSKVFDAAVTITGPEKAIAGSNVTLMVGVTRTEDKTTKVKISIDGVEVYNQENDKDQIPITQSFTAGKHEITAEILTNDSVSQNNIYDYLLTVVDKPKILVVSSKQSGLDSLLGQLYSVTDVSTMPTTVDALKPYYGVVIIDSPLSSISSGTDALRQYLQDGNGLLVVGGPHSYDYGNYKNSVFESLLPVSVGKAKDKGGVTNIVLAIDLSGSVEGGYTKNDQGQLVYEKSDKPALIRSLVLSVLQNIDLNNNVGVVVVGSQSNNSSENLRDDGSLISWDYVGGYSLGGVSVLGPKAAQLEDAVSRVQGGGQAPSQYWIAAPIKALESASGSKNVIIITDGQSCTQNCVASQGGSDEAATLNLAATLAAQGGKVYTIGVVPGTNDDFLQQIASTGNGIYFNATENNKIRILFGDPTQNNQSDDAFGLVVLNQNHFITKGVPLQATMYGYNEVVPKSYASLLVTAGNGNPAITVWNYGVGRVASITTYNGDDYGELLANGNNLIISRTGNWIIGDPERKQDSVISVPHFQIGETGQITVTSDKIPDSTAGLNFVPKGNGVYTSSFTPTQIGFGNISGIPYAASYPSEYEQVGMNPNLEQALTVSGGVVFDSLNADNIIEHAKTIRQLQEVNSTPWRGPLFLFAALLFLFEIALRRIYELMRARNV